MFLKTDFTQQSEKKLNTWCLRGKPAGSRKQETVPEAFQLIRFLVYVSGGAWVERTGGRHDTKSPNCSVLFIACWFWPVTQ